MSTILVRLVSVLLAFSFVSMAVLGPLDDALSGGSDDGGEGVANEALLDNDLSIPGGDADSTDIVSTGTTSSDGTGPVLDDGTIYPESFLATMTEDERSLFDEYIAYLGGTRQFDYEGAIRNTSSKDDADNDGLTNKEEFENGCSPLMADTDGDYLPDGWEFRFAFKCNDPTDAMEDPDGDGMVNLEEYIKRCNPLDPDTDRDGMNDLEDPFCTIPQPPPVNEYIIIPDDDESTNMLGTDFGGTRMFFRIASYDTYDGWSWNGEGTDIRSFTDTSTEMKDGTAKRYDAGYTLWFNGSWNVVPHPHYTTRITPEVPNDMSFQMDELDTVEPTAAGMSEIHIDIAKFNFTDASKDGATSPTGEAWERYTALPDTLPARIGERAAEVTDGITSPFRKVEAIVDYVKNQYTEGPPGNPGEGQDHVDFIIFDSDKTATKEQLVIAAGVLVRTLDIPTRVVQGYHEGELLENNSRRVNGGSARMWIESYFDKLGWVEFDLENRNPNSSNEPPVLFWAKPVSGDAPMFWRLTGMSESVTGGTSQQTGHWRPTNYVSSVGLGQQANGLFDEPTVFSTNEDIEFQVFLNFTGSWDAQGPLQWGPDDSGGLLASALYQDSITTIGPTEASTEITFNPEEYSFSTTNGFPVSNYTFTATVYNASEAQKEAAVAPDVEDYTEFAPYVEVPRTYTTKSSPSYRVYELSQELTSNETSDYKKVEAIMQYLVSDSGVNLTSDIPQGPDCVDPVDCMLFGEKKEGDMNSFLDAFVYMIRMNDIPSRLYLGFEQGKKLANGTYEINATHSKVLTEIYLMDIGWQTFHMSPSGGGGGGGDNVLFNVTPADKPAFWRITTFDSYAYNDPIAWRQTTRWMDYNGNTVTPDVNQFDTREQVEYSIEFNGSMAFELYGVDLVPVNTTGGFIPTALHATQLQNFEPLNLTYDDWQMEQNSISFQVNQPIDRLNFTAMNYTYSDEMFADAQVPTDPAFDKYLGLPADSDFVEALDELAFQATGNFTSPYDKAKGLEAFIKANYQLGGLEVVGDRVESFLFGDAKMGGPNEFVGAFVLLARSLGIPTRFAVGYKPGTVATPDDGGPDQLQVKSSDQHKWAEVYFVDLGWIIVDVVPTPGGGGGTDDIIFRTEEDSPRYFPVYHAMDYTGALDGNPWVLDQDPSSFASFTGGDVTRPITYTRTAPGPTRTLPIQFNQTGAIAMDLSGLDTSGGPGFLPTHSHVTDLGATDPAQDVIYQASTGMFVVGGGVSNFSFTYDDVTYTDDDLRSAGAPAKGSDADAPDGAYDYPSSVPEMVRETALTVVGHANASGNALDIARAIETYLKENFAAGPQGQGSSSDLVGRFLQSPTGQGTPMEISSAFVIMARTQHLPARLAVGFRNGSVNEESNFTLKREVKSADAYTWAQVYFNQFGWVDFDPVNMTPQGGGGGGGGPEEAFVFFYTPENDLGLPTHDSQGGSIIYEGTLPPFWRMTSLDRFVGNRNGAFIWRYNDTDNSSWTAIAEGEALDPVIPSGLAGQNTTNFTAMVYINTTSAERAGAAGFSASSFYPTIYTANGSRMWTDGTTMTYLPLAGYAQSVNDLNHSFNATGPEPADYGLMWEPAYGALSAGSDVFHYNLTTRMYEYSVADVEGATIPVNDTNLSASLELPGEMPDILKDLAETYGGNGTPYDQAMGIADFLTSREMTDYIIAYVQSLVLVLSSNQSVNTTNTTEVLDRMVAAGLSTEVAQFFDYLYNTTSLLSGSHPWFEDQDIEPKELSAPVSFTSAYIFMLRYHGIPARYAGGFSTGARGYVINDTFYAEEDVNANATLQQEAQGLNISYGVKNSDWTIVAEIFTEELGWVPFNVTPDNQYIEGNMQPQDMIVFNVSGDIDDAPTFWKITALDGYTGDASQPWTILDTDLTAWNGTPLAYRGNGTLHRSLNFSFEFNETGGIDLSGPVPRFSTAGGYLAYGEDIGSMEEPFDGNDTVGMSIRTSLTTDRDTSAGGVRADGPVKYWTEVAYNYSFNESNLDQAIGVWGNATYSQYQVIPDVPFKEDYLNLSWNVTSSVAGQWRSAKAIANYFIGEGTGGARDNETNWSYNPRVRAFSGDAFHNFMSGTGNGTAMDFATAFVILARMNNITARPVIGYTQGTEERNKLVVREADSTVYAEVFLKNIGWVPIEVVPEMAAGEGEGPPGECSPDDPDCTAECPEGEDCGGGGLAPVVFWYHPDPDSGDQSILDKPVPDYWKVGSFSEFTGVPNAPWANATEPVFGDGSDLPAAQDLKVIRYYQPIPLLSEDHTFFIEMENESALFVNGSFFDWGQYYTDIFSHYLANTTDLTPGLLPTAEHLVSIEDVTNGTGAAIGWQANSTTGFVRSDQAAKYFNFTARFWDLGNVEPTDLHTPWRNLSTPEFQAYYDIDTGIVTNGNDQEQLERQSRFENLTDTIVHNITLPFERASAIEQYLYDNYNFTYGGSSDDRDYASGDDPSEVEIGDLNWTGNYLYDFLFVDREGDSMAFSTAFVAMARYLGIPSRVAIGFETGELNDNGSFAVRTAHQRAWTQVYFNETAWIDFDPTPPPQGTGGGGGGGSGSPPEDPPSRITIDSWTANLRKGQFFKVNGTVEMKENLTLEAPWLPLPGAAMDVIVLGDNGDFIVGAGVSDSSGNFHLVVDLSLLVAPGPVFMNIHVLPEHGEYKGVYQFIWTYTPSV